ncbi:E3 ubiquitin-protein ligase TRIM32-like [Frankliniella occidentalis]|uniref:E3 ubiquitin-protein ligase TRIM32-like n=1 Tax=Frankliniella occidentalis TaxID=133901 RepID=A0A9C6WZ35_FRAOC|nr:E3 ubiquitin-protein ligase TRIM32-like [Frankliniella occidentalis]
MGPQCDICFLDFDVDRHRPKVLPCGHTICKECVENPGLGRKCPTCRKDLATDPGELIDNIYLLQMIESDGAPPCKRCKTAETRMQQLQRGADAGRQVVQQLRQVLPLAVEALTRQLDTSVAQLRRVELALQREAAGAEAEEQLQVAAGLEDSLRVLTTECSVVADRDGATWRTPAQLGVVGDIVRALLLQLQGQEEKLTALNLPRSLAGCGSRPYKHRPIGAD